MVVSLSDEAVVLLVVLLSAEVGSLSDEQATATSDHANATTTT